ncbi:CEP19-like protein-domain-containing protein [Scenedesmus sp. NREL 46B-D3]|nr:CEP19-like protein-domain-containing protein [Scenedesmus sp. NREL 46B-D3]
MDGGEDDGGDCLVLDPKWVAPDGGEIDLNKVSDCELRLAKAQMNAAFQLNQLKPGDPSYVYDKQADFSAARGSNDWDDE